MDFINKVSGNGSKPSGEPQQQNKQAGSAGFMDKLHGMVGGGPESEKKEGTLDKGRYLWFTIHLCASPFSPLFLFMSLEALW